MTQFQINALPGPLLESITYPDGMTDEYSSGRSSVAITHPLPIEPHTSIEITVTFMPGGVPNVFALASVGGGYAGVVMQLVASATIVDGACTAG